MLRHIVLMEFAAGTSREWKVDFAARVSTLQDLVPEAIRVSCGVVTTQAEYVGSATEGQDTGFDLAVVVDFAGWKEWEAYRDHPDHMVLAESANERIVRKVVLKFEPAMSSEGAAGRSV